MSPASPDPAVRLLLACGRADLGVAAPAEVAQAARAVTDWRRVQALVQHHRISPLIHQWLVVPSESAAPPEFRDWLLERFRTQAFRALAQTQELLRLLRRFEERGISVLAFKGPVQARQLYGQVARREFLDLDLLVREAGAAAAVELLRAEGYQPHYPLTAEQFARFRSVDFELGWFHPERGIAVDLHWGLAPVQFADAFPEEDTWRDPATLVLSGQPVPTLAPGLLASFLVLHHTKHNWAWLAWIQDLAMLLRTMDSAAWEQLVRDARERRISRMLRLGCHLVHTLFQLPLPATVAASVRADPKLARLAHAVQAELWNVEPHPLRFGIYRGAMDSPADVGRYWRHTIFTPRPEDWRVLDLPRPFHFLYAPLRLARLVAKRLLPSGPHAARDADHRIH